MKEYIEENDIERGFIIEAKEGSIEEGKILLFLNFNKKDKKNGNYKKNQNNS